jgi:hypothetical protein
MKQPKPEIKFLNKDGHLNENAIGIYVDEHLHNDSSTLPKEVHQHLEGCQECKLALFEVYEMMRESTSLEKETGTEKMIPDLTPPFNYNRLAAGLLILIIPVGLFFWLTAKGPEFDPNPILENFLDIQYRGETVKLVSPPLGEEVSIPIHFEWTGTEETSLQFIILDNQAVPVKTISVTGNTFSFNDPLPIGLYYCKLTGKDGLLFVGKFKIE